MKMAEYFLENVNLAKEYLEKILEIEESVIDKIAEKILDENKIDPNYEYDLDS
jgi:hypothetical protein